MTSQTVFKEDLDKVIQKVKQSSLPERFKNKLIIDLTYIAEKNVPDLCAIVLFGSCARGTMRVTSDIDLMLIVEKKWDRSLSGDIASELDEEVDGVSTDVKFYTRESFETGNTIFLREVRRDGRILWRCS